MSLFTYCFTLSGITMKYFSIYTLMLVLLFLTFSEVNAQKSKNKLSKINGVYKLKERCVDGDDVQSFEFPPTITLRIKGKNKITFDIGYGEKECTFTTGTMFNGSTLQVTFEYIEPEIWEYYGGGNVMITGEEIIFYWFPETDRCRTLYEKIK